MKKPPYRTCIGIMILWTTAMNYCFRTYFQVTLIAMLNKNVTKTLDDGTKVEELPPDYGPRYSWDAFQEGQLVGAFYYGYTAISLPAGPIVEFFGPYWTVIVSTVVCALFTCFSVLVVMESWIPLFCFRIIVGFACGMHYPALQCIIGRWAPPQEKGKFVACLMGNVLGTVLTQVIVGFLIENHGWPWGFYFTGFFAVFFLIGWVVLVADYPGKSWFCSKEEVEHIAETQQGAVNVGKSKPPLLKMLTSIPFLTLVVAQFGNLWGLYLIMQGVPKFTAEVLHFNVKSVGFWSSTPSLSRFVLGFVFGGLADFLLKKEIPLVYIRKGFILFSHVLPGVMLFLFFVIGNSVALAIILLDFTLGFNGASVVTVLANPQDLAPNFAATQYGIMNFVGSTTGFLIPLIIGEITKEKSELPEWLIIFSISAIIYILCGVLFIFFGSEKLQPWNEKKTETAAEAAA